MKKALLLLSLMFLGSNISLAQDIIELEPTDSMSIAGKGPGQDAAINPYLGMDSVAIVENIGKNEFSIRLQKKGAILKTISIKKGEKKKVELLKGVEMYFDAEDYAKAKVEFKPIS
ncbi:hypothetical protein Q2T40_08050 [Winogradskyella maritima]|uniref:Uncharacterized protein n=1 Tax=Winogradskyella maritima TaxID=1517766 RepID=A0ABV8AKK8_9FLAO|nr:hypothetical protein [Winogradskyella maritima]